jgi:hypothetical protein
MQIGKFVLPRHGLTVSSESKEDRYLRSYKEDLPRRWVCLCHLSSTVHDKIVVKWFNDSYYGDGVTSGVRGHHWHVFGTVSYCDRCQNAVSFAHLHADSRYTTRFQWTPSYDLGLALCYNKNTIDWLLWTKSS